MKESIEWLNSYPTWIKITVPCLFLAIVLLLLLGRMPAAAKPAPFAVEHRKELVLSLGKYLQVGEHSVDIEFASLKERENAKLLAACFTSSGWRVMEGNVSLEDGRRGFPTDYIRGVKVRSVNLHLAESIADELKTAGLSDISTEVIIPDIKPDSPKWDYANRHIKIFIGHPD